MDMLDKYLAAVAAQLPVDQREDIIAELKDLILSRFEAREEELGRDLTDEEREAILREVGHPLVVAARYRKGPDSLVGPELFPYWLFAAKAGLLIVAAVAGLSLLVGAISDPGDIPQAFGQAVQKFISGGVTIIGVITLIAAVMEHYAIRPKWMTEWRVRDLESFGIADTSKWSAALGLNGSASPLKVRVGVVRSGAKPWPGSDFAFSFVATGLFVLWWVGMLHFPVGVIDLWGVPAEVKPAPIWMQLYWPILGYAVACMVVDLVSLARPYARRMRAGLKIATSAFGVWLAWTIFQAGHWFTLVRGDLSARVEGGQGFLSLDQLRALGSGDSADLTVWATNWGGILSWIIAVVGLSLVVEIAVNLWRLARADRD